MLSKSFLNRFKRLDAYAKTLDDFRIRTTTGAAVTLVSTVIIVFLVLIEIWSYLTPVFQPEIVVDGGKMEKLPINFDITFPNIPCHMLSLDIMDESGQHISNYEHDVFKVRLDENGKEINTEKQTVLSNPNAADDLAFQQQQNDENYCGPCYGAAPDGECCNTCDQVKAAYAKASWAFNPGQIEQCIKEGIVSALGDMAKEGCRMHGHLLVNKLRGNFHFSPGPSFTYGSQHVHDVRNFLFSNYNFKHSINHLQFGDQTHQVHKQKRTAALALTNPLDGTKWGADEGVAMHQFFLKIVPTQFNFISGRYDLRTFQYSVSRQERNLALQSGASGAPGVYFHMDFSPMRVIYTELHKPLARVLVSICSIIGGIFTVASIVDGFLYKAGSQRKNQMGKSL
ncbi:endoplasmic reticulum vesicle transporter-domain-containing protein [Halteromyces radiatus]|uniref:endoplasmic reticulum vesicle transporter-domain-containing protein n=1 Tax=Halteromyces radiatus TaxID=101107 RepID=UPI00221ED3E0|nr:endoplasmic reticulum vesicle transporter-domain-containing protein [Halteromyces radiatus]KAI8098853.1 endoplasmic reticulum vesicle transporter-domain-containing protein [Halteromyces radiatus]